MSKKQITDDSEVIERFEVTEAPKKSSFQRISVAAACLLLVAGITDIGVWMLQSMKNESPIKPGQEITISESELVTTIEDTGATESSDELHRSNHNFDFTVAFDFGDMKKVVDSEMITDWLMKNADGTAKVNSDGDIVFDYSRVGAFVAEMAAETDTWGKDRDFHATVDGLMTVPWTGMYYSTYGWEIDQTETLEQLIKLLHEGESVTVEPVYKNKGYVRGEDGIGTTYIEADISEQHVWVYVDGEIAFECDFVSGTETDPERKTPRGICQILYKKTDVTLGAYDVSGYEKRVKFWMPFNYLGCGFHDTDRDAYGGEIYQSDGSHGCLELSYEDTQTLFDLVEVGMPCIVHD